MARCQAHGSRLAPIAPIVLAALASLFATLGSLAACAPKGHVEGPVQPRASGGDWNRSFNGWTEGMASGDISQSQYLIEAKEFAAEIGAGFREGFIGNFIVKYDPATRRTLVGHAPTREIRTFYRADSRAADPFEEAMRLARELSGL